MSIVINIYPKPPKTTARNVGGGVVEYAQEEAENKDMLKLTKSIIIDGEKHRLKLTFDIIDFIGDGIFTLVVYGKKGEKEFETPFASSMGLSKNWWIEAKEVFKSANC